MYFTENNIQIAASITVIISLIFLSIYLHILSEYWDQKEAKIQPSISPQRAKSLQRRVIFILGVLCTIFFSTICSYSTIDDVPGILSLGGFVVLLLIGAFFFLYRFTNDIIKREKGIIIKTYEEKFFGKTCVEDIITEQGKWITITNQRIKINGAKFYVCILLDDAQILNSSRVIIEIGKEPNYKIGEEFLISKEKLINNDFVSWLENNLSAEIDDFYFFNKVHNYAQGKFQI